MKILINPAYESERELLTRIPEEQYQVDHVFCEKRNWVVLATLGSYQYVIKRFKRPLRVNQIAYTFLRKDKALRSYENAFRLRAAHFDTPEPVAYIALYSKGLFHTGYYISRYHKSKCMNTMLEETTDSAERDRLCHAFIDYTYSLHRNAIYPKDYNLGNILVTHDEQGYHFSLVDINRMKFQHHPTYEEAMSSFDQMGIKIPQFEYFIPMYAERAGEDPELGIYLMLKQRYRRLRKVHARKVYKRIFGKK